MTNTQYLDELRRQLQGLPQEEIDSCIRYYEEYLAEAGAEGMDGVLERLGSPAQAAAQVKADRAIQSMEPGAQRPKSTLRTLGVVLLGLFAAPIGLPLALAAGAVVVALAAVALSVLICFFALAGAFMLGGLAMLTAGGAAFMASPATALLCMGMGAALIGLGGLVGMGSWALAKLCIRGLIRLTNAMRRKKR